MKTGATAVFDERYGETVRVVGMGEFSRELCGGTHVTRTGDIGFLKIVHESAVAAGVRRIEAVTGRGAVAHVRRMEDELRKSAALLRTGLLETAERTEKLLKRERELEREIETLKGKLAAKDSGDLMGPRPVGQRGRRPRDRGRGGRRQDPPGFRRQAPGPAPFGDHPPREPGGREGDAPVSGDEGSDGPVPCGKDHQGNRPARRRERRGPARHGPGGGAETGASGSRHSRNFRISSDKR